MKKQYLIGLLGLIAISVPIGNSLLIIDQKEISSSVTTAEYKDYDTGINIQDDSEVRVLDNDNSNDVSAGDQVDSIYFHTKYVAPDNPQFKIGRPNQTALNIFEQDVYNGPAEDVESWNSISYSQIGKNNSSTTNGELIVDVNSDINSNFHIWTRTLTDASENFAVTAEGFPIDYNPKKSDWEDNLIEGYVGLVEIKLSSKVSSVNSATVKKGTITEEEATIDYNVTLGKENDGAQAKLESVELWDNDADSALAFDGDLSLDGEGNGSMDVTGLIPGTNYDADLKVKFSNESEIETIPVEGLITKLATTIDAANVSTIKADNVTIDYTIDLGKDEHAADLKLSSVELYDTDNGESLGYDDDLSLDADGNGSFKVTNLTPSAKYKTELRVKTETIDGIPEEEGLTKDIEEFQMQSGLPTIEELEAVNLDEENEIMQVEGQIASAGAMINNVNIIDTNLTEENNIVGTQEINSNEKIIEYSVFTPNYDGDPSHYQLEITYTINEELLSIQEDITDVNDQDKIHNDKDLGYLLNSSFGIWIILGIIALVLIIIAAIAWTLAHFLKHKQEKETK